MPVAIEWHAALKYGCHFGFHITKWIIKLMIEITSCSADDRNKWDQYLMNHPQGNFYQRYGWKDINQRNFGHSCYFRVAKENGTIVGLFPVVHIRSLIFGNILSSMPFVNFGGICSDSDAITQELINDASKLTEKCNADYMEIRSTQTYTSKMPTSENKVSMTLDLKDDPDILWRNFKSKHRTNIRRVYKNNVHVKHGRQELLDIFYNLISRSWKGLGTPIYRKSYFADILETFPEETRIFVAFHNNTPIATAFNGYYKDTAEGMWAGALPQERSIQANYVLYWEMIKHACENGYQHYHLGRSSINSGAEVFKKKWHAYSTQLYWQYVLHRCPDIPQLNVSNPKFDLAIKVWRILPLALTTTLGPLIAKSIP